MTFFEAAAYVLGVGLLLIFIRIFIKPVKTCLLFMVNSALGGVGLYIFNLFGVKFGLTLGINIVTSAVCGLLGVPGLITLALVKIMLGV